MIHDITKKPWHLDDRCDFFIIHLPYHSLLFIVSRYFYCISSYFFLLPNIFIVIAYSTDRLVTHTNSRITEWFTIPWRNTGRCYFSVNKSTTLREGRLAGKIINEHHNITKKRWHDDRCDFSILFYVLRYLTHPDISLFCRILSE